MNIYTVQEAAAYLGTSARSVKYYLALKQLRPARYVGQSPLFTQEELDRFRTAPRKSRGRPARVKKD